MLLRWMKTQPMWLMDEAGEAGAGGGAGADLNIDMGAAVEEIGAGLGLGEDTSTNEDDDTLPGGSATPPSDKGAQPDKKPAPTPDAGKEARERAERATKLDAARKQLQDQKVDLTGKTDDEILALATPQPKSAPKSWKKELHDAFGKLDPAVQDYILERETQVEQGFLSNKEHVEFGRKVRDVVTPYEAMLTSQGVDTPTALRYLLNAHYNLSHVDEGQRLQTFLQVAKSYRIDPAKAIAALQSSGQTPADEPPAVRELRERTARMEQALQSERAAKYNQIKAEAAQEIAAFAADPKHPYFKEVEHQIALLMQDPSITLEQAYEQAVYANPVTRAKELDRLRQEAEKAAREEAEKKAAEATKARGTRIRGDERGRESPDPLGSMEDTMRETLREIRSRQE